MLKSYGRFVLQSKVYIKHIINKINFKKLKKTKKIQNQLSCLQHLCIRMRFWPYLLKVWMEMPAKTNWSYCLLWDFVKLWGFYVNNSNIKSLLLIITWYLFLLSKCDIDWQVIAVEQTLNYSIYYECSLQLMI